MRVILSIKPEFADKIFNGTKLFEYRRIVFKNPNVRTVLVYASSPVQKIIGEFEIEQILKQDLASLWSLTKDHSGISEEYFYQYFKDKEVGFAIEVKSAQIYSKPKCIKQDFNHSPPQSFVYA